ncbi:sulfite exporter TauE/SafE family protein [Nocardioides terrisoli]|uniref:sulfite exporter TauE/SafE family protein n=1 Tax=Nocardioides terrisoli TaxID=3388267 RepID=UPI00287BB285|nr:sulfite exporter TauE/SafE family protein [Nocardioides marmorisolisilvae]
MSGLTPLGFLVIALVVLVAAALQASIGFGMGMLAAPVVAIVDPSLIPATLLFLALVVTSMTVLTERRHVDIGGTGWAIAGRVPGTVAGAVLVAVLPERGLALLLAAVVLLGVVLATLGWAPQPARPTLVLAGATSGLLGTATSIGGPPMALVWQGKSGPGLRGSMNSFGLIGGMLSITVLLASGAVSGETFRVAVLLLPMPILGFWASRYINRFLDPRRLRRTVIVVSCFGAVILIGQQLAGLLG